MSPANVGILLPPSHAAPGDAKRPTNVSVRGDLVEAARRAGVNLSGLLERALIEELARVDARGWRAESQRAIVAYNDHLLLYGTFRTSARRRRSF